MLTLPASDLSAELRPVALYAAAILCSLARAEALGARPPRLLEPNLATWTRFRGRLSDVDLLRLLAEDEAVLHPIPFHGPAIDPRLRLDRLPESLITRWLGALADLNLSLDGTDYIAAMARLLGVPSRLARAELHQVKPHQRVLELPGTGGQLAHYLVLTQPGLSLQHNFTLACDGWQELVLAGLVAMDLGAPGSDAVVKVKVEELKALEHPLRQTHFDFVIGLHPDKGGLFQVEDQLATWFHGARFLLV